MDKKIIPYFQHPTTVCFIDDERAFLDLLKKCISDKNRINKFYQDPIEVLNSSLVKKSKISKVDDFKHQISLQEEDVDEDTVYTVDYKSIYNQIYNKDRFQEVSVFVVDYAMPKLDGINFFKKIKELPAKKILLTSKASPRKGIDVLNTGLVHYFFEKDINTGQSKLNNKVDKMCDNYFVELSQKIFPLSPIHQSSVYITLFEKWQEENKIIEYYQCDELGSYLGISSDGHISFLALTTDKEIETQINMAFNAGIEDAMTKKLSKREQLIFLFSDIEKDFDIPVWKKLAYPIFGHFNVNKEKYYYSIIKNNAFSLKTKEIVPFSRFKGMN